MSDQYRYPGAKPFQTEESNIFYGREKDTEDLNELIQLEPLIILHSKSGMGKSSLVNAGLIPKIKEYNEYDYFKIRFHAYSEKTKSTPLETTLATVQGKSKLLDKIKPQNEKSIWYNLKSQQLKQSGGKGVLLIFDQFEELFTYPEEEINSFAKHLSEALYINIPQRFRENRKKGFENNQDFLQEEELTSLNQPLKLRIVTVIRSDRMNLLSRLKQYLPTILNVDYELLPLAKEQAEDAILSPAYHRGNFITPVFDFENSAIEYLLNFLSKDGQEPIESFQLQILCEYVEKMVVERQKKKVIEKTDIDNPTLVLENYYRDKISAIPNIDDQIAARKFIEEGLIFEEEERRLSIYEGQVYKSFNISPKLLRQLLNTHLIRSEPSLRGGYTYELSHDTLVEPVLKAKVKRIEEERIKEEEEARRVTEAKLKKLREEAEAERIRAQKEQSLREQAEVNEKRAKQRTFLAVVILIVALGLAAIAGWQYSIANSAQQETSMALLAVQEEKRKTDFANQLLEQKTKEYQDAASEIISLQDKLQGLLGSSQSAELNDAINNFRRINEKYKRTNSGILPTEGETNRQEKENLTLEEFEFTPIASASKNPITVGEQFKADISIGALPISVLESMAIEVNGKPLISKNGFATFTTIAPSPGNKKYEVDISLINPGTGEREVYSKEFEYQVVPVLENSKKEATPGLATVAAEKMNVLYIGVDNPISISVTGVSYENFSVEGKGSGLSLKDIGKGKYIASVAQPGEATITVYGKNFEPVVFNFRVKRLPEPVARLGRNSGGSIGNGEFKAHQGVVAFLDNFDFDARCEILGYYLVYAPKDGDAVESQNVGARFNDKSRELVGYAKPGDVYYFENVRARCPGDKNGQIINSMMFTIR